MRANGKADDSNVRTPPVTGVAVALVFALGLLIPVHAGSLKMLHADETYNGRTVKLVVGESVEISLAENPTTGYRWRIPEVTTDPAKDGATEAASSPCPCVKDSFEPGLAGVAGQGGIHHWQYRAAEMGTCKIELEYRRSWEKDKLAERTFRLQVEVRKGVPGKSPP